MSVSGTQSFELEITDSATLIFPLSVANNEVAGNHNQPVDVLISNGGGQTVELGGSDLTFGEGFPVPDGESVRITLRHDDLYGIVTSSTADIRVLVN